MSQLSIKNAIWLEPSVSRQADESLLDYILRSRGIADKTAFLEPASSSIHEPELLGDMEAAVKRIKDHVAAGHKIAVYGDYDVDGVCATAIVWEYLYNELKADVIPYIPSRFDEGYGLNQNALDELVGQGVRLVITVDCGVKDVELVDKFKGKLEFVITDHHTPTLDGANEVKLPDAPVVHPLHPHHKYPFAGICGATVAWKLVCGLAGSNRAVCNQYLDLVALASVCDVMPLVDENRALVKQGLQMMRRGNRPGLVALSMVAGFKLTEADTYHCGFIIGPRINAAGRMERAITALRLLVTPSAVKAQQYARELMSLNTERQQKTIELLEQAEAQVALQADSPALFIAGAEWPEGIVGLVAGKLAEKYHKPVFVGSISREGIVKASGRSAPGFHLAENLSDYANLLVRFGGHEQAAGLTASLENWNSLQQLMTQAASNKISLEQRQKKLQLDAWITPHDFSIESIKQHNLIAPFGQGNLAPIVGMAKQTIIAVRKFSQDKHLAWRLAESPNYEILFFNADDKLKQLNNNDVVNIAGQLKLDTWNGKEKPSMIANDAIIL